ncbi:hypothetical protein [Myxococcus stipitatus]|uniref:hypothetical protein n=1 Tax=Myxococcus stipitatus TaxID=83455 RepID=UPI000315C50C|nr:hypothetical protein [Myxococcus stipitatus]
MLEAEAVLARVWLCLCLLLFAPMESGLSLALFDRADAVCELGCPDDNERGQCDSDCADCTCCGHVRAVAAPTAHPLFWLEAYRPPLIAQDEDAPASADPDGILHVPRDGRA